MHTRKIIIIVVISCAGLLAVCAVFVWFFYSLVTGTLFGYQRPQTPAQLKEARIVVGKDFLSRSVFVETTPLERIKGIGNLSNVAVGEFDSHPGLDVVVAGHAGALVFDRNGTRRARVLFQFRTSNEKIGPFTTPKVDDSLGDVQVIDIEGDGACEYLARGGLDGAGVFDHQGKLLWTYGKYTKEKTYIDNLTIGDLDGDGVAEFVVSWNGIEVFDKSGKRKSQLAEEYGASQIEVVDTNGDGQNEIISVGGTLKIRDSAGRVIKDITIPVYLGTFDLCNMPGKKEPVVLGEQDGSLWLIDFKGNTVAQFNAPLSEFDDTVEQTPAGEFRGTSVYRSKGVWIKLANDRPEYLAVINEFAAIDRSVLDVFTPAGELVYQEVLPEECSSIAILPPADSSGVQELLVAGEQTVWRYRIK